MAEAGTRLTVDEMLEDLAGIVGQAQVMASEGKPEPEYRISAPLTLYPADERQIQAVLAWANGHGVRIVPQGGGTKDAFGSAGPETDVILSLRNLSGVLEHSVGDLTVTVLPGTPLRELREQLNKAGQFLPLDPAWEARSTIGGAIAANASGPRRALYGSARDHLIASRVVYPDGSLIRTGQKVVKNVAGYDMNKLFVGSMGTLGVFTELTFKVRPVAATAGVLLMQAEDPVRLRSLLENLSDSPLEPCAVEWLNARSATDLIGHRLAHPVMLAAFEDVERSVLYQLDWLKQACADCGVEAFGQVIGRERTEELFARLGGSLPNSVELPDDQLIITAKLLSRMSDVPQVGEFVTQSAEAAGLDPAFHGGCYTGISRAVVRTEWARQERVASWLNSVEAFLGSLGGRQVLETVPRRMKPMLRVWGEESGDWGLMKGIKHKIDPRRILNPGRFVGGI